MDIRETELEWREESNREEETWLNGDGKEIGHNGDEYYIMKMINMKLLMVK